MRLIGLDPGLRSTGWGVIEVEGSHLRHVANGAVAPDVRASTAERLAELFDALAAILEKFAPVAAAVEETFVNRNASSTLKLGLARGVVLLAPARFGIPVAEYAANAVKKAVVGVGHAEKTQIQMMVQRLLPGIAFAGPDAADALAVAICHAHHAATRRVWEQVPVTSPVGRGRRAAAGEGLPLRAAALPAPDSDSADCVTVAPHPLAALAPSPYGRGKLGSAR